MTLKVESRPRHKGAKGVTSGWLGIIRTIIAAAPGTRNPESIAPCLAMHCLVVTRAGPHGVGVSGMRPGRRSRWPGGLVVRPATVQAARASCSDVEHLQHPGAFGTLPSFVELLQQRAVHGAIGQRGAALRSVGFRQEQVAAAIIEQDT